jgi:hypothetical protein
MPKDDPAELRELRERRRRREELLAQRAALVAWRDRLLARRRKYLKAHQDLAHRISQQV